MKPKELIQQTVPVTDPPLPKADLPKPELKPAKKQSQAQQLILGVILGIAFGFLLQKGGVAKYHILIGALLLEDFTVAKVMLSAIVVGMVGVLAMNYFGWIQLQIKPTRYAANIFGGLLFGVGFGLIAYCPGTGAAAIGQGNFDAIFGVLGLIAGSYIFAEASSFLELTINKWGDRGKITLADLINVRRTIFALAFIPLLIIALIVLERTTTR
jgi:hypothetical protein